MSRSVQARFRRLGVVTGAVLAGLWVLGFLITMGDRPAAGDGPSAGPLRDVLFVLAIGAVLFALPYALARAIGGFIAEHLEERRRAEDETRRER
jgi:hypothetical protein